MVGDLGNIIDAEVAAEALGIGADLGDLHQHRVLLLCIEAVDAGTLEAQLHLVSTSGAAAVVLAELIDRGFILVGHAQVAPPKQLLHLQASVVAVHAQALRDAQISGDLRRAGSLGEGCI